jgi:hypothetical protein
VNGGLIQKELAAPHNDWWTKSRPLPLGSLTPDASVDKIYVERLGDGVEDLERGGLSLSATTATVFRTFNCAGQLGPCTVTKPTWSPTNGVLQPDDGTIELPRRCRIKRRAQRPLRVWRRAICCLRKITKPSPLPPGILFREFSMPADSAPYRCIGESALKGETERAAVELVETRRLSGDDRYSSIARLRAAAVYLGGPEALALFEVTFFAGLRKAGMPEH